jgi:DNA polymerase V
MFALVDCNNFYVSCEKVFNPALEGRPVIVLSNNDGCVISRSDEAKQMGFKMGEPVFKKRELLKQQDVVVFSSNYTLYGDMSQRVQQILEGFSPDSEAYSIDECFLGIGHIPLPQLPAFGHMVQHKVTKCTGIPVGVGIGATKTLAKIANKMAKNDPKNQGVFVFNSYRKVQTALRNTPVDEIWGIGRQYARLMEKNGICTAYDFTQVNDHWIKKNMSVMGLRIKNELLGQSCIPIEAMVKTKKAIATTRAFGHKTERLELIREAVATYATRCGEKLRKQKCVANLLTVFIHTDPFNKKEKYLHFSQTVGLPIPSDHQAQLVKYALKALKNIYLPGIKYKKAGVIVDGLEPGQAIQSSLFDTFDIPKHRSLSEATDLINQRFGRDTLKLSVQGDGKEWQLRQEKLSRKFTTQLKDIIVVKAK